MAVAIKTSMGEIHDGAMTPIQREAIVLIPRDAVLEGNTWANRAIALSQGQAREWPTLVVELFTMTLEARAQVIKVLSTDMKEARRANLEDHKMESKQASKAARSAAVYLSMVSTIAKAITAGMTPMSTCIYHGLPAPTPREDDADNEEWCNSVCLDMLREEGSLAKMYQHAMEFSKSKAGRTPDSFLVKFGKWLDKNVASEDDATGAELHDALIKLFNKLAFKEQAAI